MFNIRKLPRVKSGVFFKDDVLANRVLLCSYHPFSAKGAGTVHRDTIFFHFDWFFRTNLSIPIENKLLERLQNVGAITQINDVRYKAVLAPWLCSHQEVTCFLPKFEKIVRLSLQNRASPEEIFTAICAKQTLEIPGTTIEDMTRVEQIFLLDLLVLTGRLSSEGLLVSIKYSPRGVPWYNRDYSLAGDAKFRNIENTYDLPTCPMARHDI